MSGVLSKLAGETAVYGLSTILARIINFFFVPFYTRILSQEQYGSLTEFMAYIAVLQVVLTLGMETGSFRFANKGPEPRSVFSNAFSSVFSFSFLVFAVMTVFSGDIASYLGYGDYPEVVTYVGLILLLDSSCAILFAKLRYEGRAWRFAVIKTVKIITETAANIFLFLFLPGWIASHPGTFVESLIPPVPDFSYPIVAILVSCVVMVICMIPDFRSIRLHVDRKLLKDMFMYSLPLMIAGLPGVVNEFLDRILFRFCMPDDVSWRAELGIYQAAVKLSVIMSLFIQMFRFAAEPFFFARANDRDSRKIYAEVMNHFVAFCMLIFLGIFFP